MRIPKRVYCLTLVGQPLVRRFILKAPQLWPAGASPITMISKLDGKPWQGSADSAVEELVKRIEAKAAELDWPPLAIWTTSGAAHDPVIDDPLTWCVATSKRVGSMVLLHKPPNVEWLRLNEDLVLNFPCRRICE